MLPKNVSKILHIFGYKNHEAWHAISKSQHLYYRDQTTVVLILIVGTKIKVYIDFNCIWTRLGLYYTFRLGNRVHYTFIFTLCVCVCVCVVS